MVSRSSPIAAARLSIPTGPPPNLSITAEQQLAVHHVEPGASTSSIFSAASATALRDCPFAFTSA